MPGPVKESNRSSHLRLLVDSVALSGMVRLCSAYGRQVLALACILSMAIGQRMVYASDVKALEADTTPLEKGWHNPPAEASPAVYWYWVSGAISRQGISRDLEAMARAGIGAAYIANVDVINRDRGDVRLFSTEWWDLMTFALSEAARVGIDIGLFNGPGWSQSGGPWISTARTMRYLDHTEVRVHGPVDLDLALPVPENEFEDLYVLAFPAPETGLARAVSIQQSSGETGRFEPLIDGNLELGADLFGEQMQEQAVDVDLSMDRAQCISHLKVFTDGKPLHVSVEVLALEADGSYAPIRRFDVDRRVVRPQLGPMNRAPVAVDLPALTGRKLRLRFTQLTPGLLGRITELQFGDTPLVERYVEKQLGKMWQTPLPPWDAYIWPASWQQGEESCTGRAIARSQVIDVTQFMKRGRLQWQVPEGDWMVQRVVLSPTGVENAPAAPEATGLEVDKLSREHVAFHYDAFVGEILRRASPQGRKAVKLVVVDSYEQGPQNWTDDFRDSFSAAMGYDPLPWLPVLSGRVVESRDRSDRFLWDLRRHVADRIATEYVGELRRKAHEDGLELWLENYGHWGFPAEFLQYGGQADQVSGEFWIYPERGLAELRAATSAAHTYGLSRVSAEAFTARDRNWKMAPWSLKALGDWAFTEGVNHFVLHVYIHQPDERQPGYNAWFGTEFNRHNTWFHEAGAWIDYLKRSQFLLQQGSNVADIAYFVGEDAPKMTGVLEPAPPPGYQYDFINAETIINRMQVHQGRFLLDGGAEYSLLVLPPLDTMTPELLARLQSLVAAGGNIYGPVPRRSPSMAHYPDADRQVSRIASEMWGSCESRLGSRVVYGRGRIYCGGEIGEVLGDISRVEDLRVEGAAPLNWTHRRTSKEDIYFLSNPSDAPVQFRAEFRIEGRVPELWDPVSGLTRKLPEFSTEGPRTAVPLSLEASESVFIVFRQQGEPDPRRKNYPVFRSLAGLDNDWQVDFDPKSGGPGIVAMPELVDWSASNLAGVRYFSGTARYRRTFRLPPGSDAQPVILELGRVRDIARVRVNGVDLGVVWTPPWRVEISQVVRPGENTLEVDVTNTWANRIIGDLGLPPRERQTWTVHPHYKRDSQLLPAGLMGPVRILSPAAGE